MNRFALCIAGLAAIISSSSSSYAGSLLSTTNILPQTFSKTGFLRLLQSTGSFTVGFNANPGDVVMISFSASCSTSGTTNQYTSIQIEVDGFAIRPTAGNNDIFCSADGLAKVQDGRAMNAVVTSAKMRSDQDKFHEIVVKVMPINGGTSLIDDLSLQVWN